MSFKYLLQTLAGGVGAALSYLYGEWSPLLTILVAFVVIDYLTGLIAAGSRGKLSSAIGFKGIGKKIGIFVIVAVAHLVDQAIGTGGTMIRDAATFFYLANELLSIIENAGVLGVPIPDVLQKAVEILEGKSDPQNGG